MAWTFLKLIKSFLLDLKFLSSLLLGIFFRNLGDEYTGLFRLYLQSGLYTQERRKHKN